MTYREKRRNQLRCLFFMAIWYAFLATPLVPDQPIKLLFIFVMWEVMIRVIATDRCWHPDTNLDDKVR